MCGLKLEMLSLFMCGIVYISASVYPKNDVVPFMGKKNEEVKNNLRTLTTTTEKTIKNCVCSKVYDPVCGSNYKSYYNICQLQCENKPGTVNVLHQGNCIPF